MKNKGTSLVIVLIALVASFLTSCSEEIFVTPKVLGKISGKVIDNVTKKPLSAVLVKLNPSGRSAQTDTTGNFSFDSLTAGKYTITATKATLYNEYVTVEVTDIQNPVVTIYMSEDIKSNRAPSKPTLISPANGAMLAGTDNMLFTWAATDPDRDTLLYDIYLYKAGETVTAPYRANFNNDSLYISNLEYNKTYYWQVVAKDKQEKVFSETWAFTTPAYPSLSYVFTREENGRYQIYAANDDKTIVKLTSDASNWRPIVSPDREKIAFISNRSTSLHIYIINRDGTGIRKITTVPIAGLNPIDLSFTWANNGSKLIYPNNNKLYSINTDGTGLTEVARTTAGRQYAGCDWNEATKTIVARSTGETVYDNELTLIRSNGETETILSSARRVGNPVLSIDGGEVLFSMDVNEFRDEEGRQIDARIFELYLPGKGLRDLSATGGTANNSSKPAGTNDVNPRYSPNGQGIIFTNVLNDGLSIPNLYITTLNGGGRTKIITNADMGYWRQQ